MVDNTSRDRLRCHLPLAGGGGRAGERGVRNHQTLGTPPRRRLSRRGSGSGLGRVECIHPAARSRCSLARSSSQRSVPFHEFDLRVVSESRIAVRQPLSSFVLRVNAPSEPMPDASGLAM